MFIDYAKIFISSGNGGRGHISFRKEKFVPKGGPDGGNGGKGGNVIFEANPHLNTLLDFRYKKKYEAPDGNAGSYANRTGRSGKNLIIKVPCGTIVKDIETGEILADLTEAGERAIVAKGGIGGRGNAEFTTSVNQAPRHAEPGIPGEERNLVLELKLIADVGLVGFPNAGKSTLISAISAAHPKIGDYPFTTLIPNIGIVSVAPEKSFAVADIPGLIEGAHEGKGLGIQFLRHVERTSILAYLLDVCSEDPLKEYEVLREELRAFNPEMELKKRIICLSKSDILDEELKIAFRALDFNDPGTEIFLISAVSGEGIEAMKWAMWAAIQNNKAPEVKVPYRNYEPVID